MTLYISMFWEEKCNLTSLLIIIVIIPYFSVKKCKEINATYIKLSVKYRAKFLDFLSKN